jgi:uncharacterized RDD family membrane protein YckC
MEYISVGRRAGAIILDAILLWIVFFVVIAATGDTTTTTTSSGASINTSGGGTSVVLITLIFFAYFVVLEATIGATLGKLAVGIRVVMADGSSLTWGASFVRNLLRIIDGLFVYLVGAILVWNSDTRQRLGDRAAKSVVVSKQSVGRPPMVPGVPGVPGSTPPPPPTPPTPPPPAPPSAE